MVIVCKKYNIKLIYFSSNYVYEGKKVITKRAIQFYRLVITVGLNLEERQLSICIRILLILRICMTEKPFVHKKAFSMFI